MTDRPMRDLRSELPADDAQGRAALQLLELCDGDPLRLAMELLEEKRKSKALLERVQAVADRAAEQPHLMRMIGEVFSLDRGEKTRQMVYVAKAGAERTEVHLVHVPEGTEVPPVLQMVYVDRDIESLLGPASELPVQQRFEAMAKSAQPREGAPELFDVRIDEEGHQQGPLLLASAEVGKEIGDNVHLGNTVRILHDGYAVETIVETEPEVNEDWLEILEIDGAPGLDELVQAPYMEKRWSAIVKAMVCNKPSRWLLSGPTGVGKTAGVRCALTDAAREAKKRAALIDVSPAAMGTALVYEMERNIGRAFQTARRLAATGDYVVAIFIDEADALLGDTGARWEGNNDRRVRNTLQQMLSNDVPGVTVFAACNPRTASWIGGPLQRRFHQIEYHRSTLPQIVQVAGLYADDILLGRLNTTREEFGTRVAHFMFADHFVVAKLHMAEGDPLEVRARDLHNCSPGKVKDLVEQFAWELEVESTSPSFDSLFEAIEREFRSYSLSVQNVFELTFLEAPANNAVQKVERIRAE